MNPRPTSHFRLIRSPGLAALFLCAVVTGSALASDAPPDPTLLARTKVSREQAQQVALAQVPTGTVQSAELEEEGGSLRWSFDLKTPGSRHVTEVGVDARTGKVIEKRMEKARDEAREKREEGRETHPAKKH